MDVMKLDVMSDLHLDLLGNLKTNEFFGELDDHLLEPGADTLVLAGDVGSLRPSERGKFKSIAERFCQRYRHVFYTPGNHEFWHTDLVSSNDFLLHEIHDKIQGFHLLRMDHPVPLEGLSFLGDTGWFPDPNDYLLQEGWPDLNYIDDADPGIYNKNRAFVDAACRADRSDSVLVTHHFPLESVATKYANNPYNVFFAFDFPKVTPKLLLHGHTHEPIDYIHPRGFRVYCNPLGYHREGTNIDFWKRVRIDV
jgi:DNA repair exonuclease SbcCD nuclease subunit